MNEQPRKTSDGLILVVDDEPQITQLLDRILSRVGYEVMIANSGVEALKLVETLTPDLVIMDITMPLMDGYESTAKMKKFNHLSGVPVIFLSGRPIDDDAGRAFAVGGAAYLRKPFDDHQIRAVVGLALSAAHQLP